MDKDSEPDVEYSYYYNTSWQIVEVRKDGAANPYKQFVWDLRYIDAPVLRWRDTNTDGTVDETLYYTNDPASPRRNRGYAAGAANMNVTALVNTSGAVVERYSYDPYGRVTVRHGVIDAAGQNTSANEWTERTAGTFENNILYAGYLYDDETGLFHVRHRTYHPTLGRWLQRDPKGYVDGMSLYEYAMSCPIGWVDSGGLGARCLTKSDALARAQWHKSEAKKYDDWAAHDEERGDKRQARHNRKMANKNRKWGGKWESESRALCEVEGQCGGWTRDVRWTPGMGNSPDVYDKALTTAGIALALSELAAPSAPGSGVEAAAKLPTLAAQVAGGTAKHYTVWIEVQCWGCTCKKGRLRAVDHGEPEWKSCDIADTAWGKQEAHKRLIKGTMVAVAVLSNNDIDAIDEQCRYQAELHCTTFTADQIRAWQSLEE